MRDWRRRDFLGSAAALTSGASPAGAVSISKVEVHLPVGLLRVRVASGVEGYSLGIDGPTAEAIIQRAAPVLAARDPLDRERVWLELQANGVARVVLSAVDVALWDLGGKLLGLPVFRMTGGLRSQIPVCKVGAASSRIENCTEQARAANRAGYEAFQDGFSGPAESVNEMARGVREAAGDRVALIHSAGGRYDRSQALRVGQTLQAFGYDALEDPMRDADRAGVGELARVLDIPIAAPVSRPDVARALTEQFPDILRIDAVRHGGFTGLVKTLRAAEAFGVSCAVAGRGPLGGFVHAHAIGAVRSARFFEDGEASDEQSLLRGGSPSGPAVRLSNAPGFGLELDWNEIEKRTNRVLRP